MKKTRSIEVDSDTFAEITYLARALGMSKKGFVGELIRNVFDIASGFETLNIMCSGRFTEGWLKLNFSGRRNIVFGQGTDEDVRQAKEILYRVKAK